MAACTPQRILIIAPECATLPALDIVPEIDAIQELGYEVRLLQGNVTEDRLFDAVRNMRAVDVIHFACHSDASGVALTNCVLSAGGILQIARQVNAQLVFLNSCTSARLAQLLVDNDVPSVIATLAGPKGEGLPDSVAKATAQTFYVMLSKLGDIHSAYKASKPAGDGWYVFLANGGYTNVITFPILEKLERIDTAIAKQTLELLKADTAIQGSLEDRQKLHSSLDKSQEGQESIHAQLISFRRSASYYLIGSASLSVTTLILLALHLLGAR